MSSYGYGRASTDKQADSPEVQRDTILRFAQTYNLPEPEIFMDAGVSGKIPLANREAGGVMCGRLKKGDILIIAKVDRAFRSFTDFVYTIEEWERMGVRIYICDLGIGMDMSSMHGKFFLRILAAFADMERQLLSTRIKEALQYKKAKGVKYTQHAGYGWMWEKGEWDPVKKKHIYYKVPHPQEREIMRWMLEVRSGQFPFSIDQIRQHLEYELGGICGPWVNSRTHRFLMAAEKLRAEGEI